MEDVDNTRIERALLYFSPYVRLKRFTPEMRENLNVLKGQGHDIRMR